MKMLNCLLALCLMTFASPVSAEDIFDNELKAGHHDCRLSRIERATVITEVQQRFYEFQNATSEIKRNGHNPDTAALTKALNYWSGFMEPDYAGYNIYTDDTVFSYPTLSDLVTGYTEFAEYFNGFSEHFSTNCVVRPDSAKKAHLSSGGGEWASLDFADPYEQITISNFYLTWVWLDHGPQGPNWYIHRYTEIGNRLYAFCPPCSAMQLNFAKTFPGATPETPSTGCTTCVPAAP